MAPNTRPLECDKLVNVCADLPRKDIRLLTASHGCLFCEFNFLGRVDNRHFLGDIHELTSLGIVKEE